MKAKESIDELIQEREDLEEILESYCNSHSIDYKEINSLQNKIRAIDFRIQGIRDGRGRDALNTCIITMFGLLIPTIAMLIAYIVLMSKSHILSEGMQRAGFIFGR